MNVRVTLASLTWGLLVHRDLHARGGLLRQEATVVLQALQSAATGLLRLLLLGDLGGLVLHLTRTCEGAVDLAHCLKCTLCLYFRVNDQSYDR